MGRSSYTLQTLANQGDTLAKAVQQLTDESTRQSGQIQKQITQAAQQNSQTQGRLNTGLRQPAGGEGAGTERKPAQGMEQQLPDGDFCGDGQPDDRQPADQRHE